MRRYQDLRARQIELGRRIQATARRLIDSPVATEQVDGEARTVVTPHDALALEAGGMLYRIGSEMVHDAIDSALELGGSAPEPRLPAGEGSSAELGGDGLDESERWWDVGVQLKEAGIAAAELLERRLVVLHQATTRDPGRGGPCVAPIDLPVDLWDAMMLVRLGSAIQDRILAGVKRMLDPSAAEPAPEAPAAWGG